MNFIELINVSDSVIYIKYIHVRPVMLIGNYVIYSIETGRQYMIPPFLPVLINLLMKVDVWGNSIEPIIAKEICTLR